MTAPASATSTAPAPAPNDPQPTVTRPTRATFTNVTAKGKPFAVHFNPVSLQIALSNTLDDKSNPQDKQKQQYVAKTSAKLTMDLIFDTTDTGSDVRKITGQVAALMSPKASGGKSGAPPTVLFEWGAFRFQGLIESYRETLDFFSYDGVPLRASVNLTLTQQDFVFSSDKELQRSSAVDVPSGNASQVAGQAGNSNAGRALAAANGLETMRFSTGPLSVDASVKLAGPVAFASGGGGAALTASAGLSAGASLGVSGGVAAGASLGGGASFGVRGPAFGGSASAGVSATEGAFAGLRVSTQPPGPALDPSRLLPTPEASAVVIGPQASFGIGGQARATGSASLGTDVGAGATAQARVRFDGG